MSTVPYYLQPTTVENKTTGEIDLSWSFDYQYPPQATYDSSGSFWNDLATGAKSIAGNVPGVIDKAIEVVSYVPTKLYEKVGQVSDAAGDKVFGFLDQTLFRLILVFAVLVIGFVVLAKSGLIKDIAGIL